MVLKGPTTVSVSSNSSSTLSKTSDAKGKFLHPNLPLLDLQAWELSNYQSEIKSFRKTLQILSQNQEKKSTQKVYDAKWVIYSNWCHRKKVNPVLAPLTVIANFFIYLFSEKKNIK